MVTDQQRETTEYLQQECEAIIALLANCQCLNTSNEKPAAFTDEQERCFADMVKQVRSRFAHLHARLKETIGWCQATNDQNLDTLCACIVWCRGWIMAQLLADGLPRTQLRTLDKFITPAIDSICMLVLYGKEQDTTLRCRMALALVRDPTAYIDRRILDVLTAPDDVHLIRAFLLLQHYRMILQNFSDFPDAVRSQLMLGTRDSTQALAGHSVLMDQLLDFIDSCEFFTAWQPDDDITARILTFHSGPWLQIVTMLALLAFQLEQQEFGAWEKAMLSATLKRKGSTALIVAEAWSIIARHMDGTALQITVSTLCELLLRAEGATPACDRLRHLLSGILSRLPTPELSAIVNELLVPVREIDDTDPHRLERALRMFSQFPINALPKFSRQRVIESIDKKASQLLDTISTILLDSSLRKRNIEAAIALAVPAECLASMLEDIEASEPQPTNITRAVENVPKLLRECNAYACEQPKALPMLARSINALIRMATLAPMLSSKVACEILAFSTQWMSNDPSGEGRLRAIRFAGACCKVTFGDSEKVKAFNLLSRVFTTILGARSPFLAREACSQFVHFATHTTHPTLVKRLAPARMQDELSNFVARRPNQFDTSAMKMAFSTDEIGYLRMFACTTSAKQVAGADGATRMLRLAEFASEIATTEVPSVAEAVSDTSPVLPAPSSNCVQAVQTIRKYLKSLRKQPNTSVDDTELRKELIGLRRDLGLLDPDGL